jgi:hypothetical protein
MYDRNVRSQSQLSRSGFDILVSGEGSQELILLGGGLEATVTNLRSGIDELDLALFGLP